MALIEEIGFSLLSPQQVKKLSVIEVVKAELYDNDGFTVEGGVMDPKLGVIEPGLRCRTCGLTVGGCFGHFGHIELVRPIIHVLYSKLIYKLLKVTCQSCNKVMNASAVTVPKKCPHCATVQKQIKFEKPYNFFEEERSLNALEMRARLEKISDEDLELLKIKGGRPEWLI